MRHAISDARFKVPLRDVVGLKPRGCRKFEKGGASSETSHVPRVPLCAVWKHGRGRRVFGFQIVRASKCGHDCECMFYHLLNTSHT